jgi:polysaccharide export outer membrane protein
MGSGLHETANLRSARLLRSEQVQPVDIYNLLYNNDLRQNVQLRSGDTIFVPGNEEQQVFVFGQVDNPGPVQMLNGRLNLLQALSTASVGSGANRSFPYDQERVRIIRSLSPTHGQLMVVDMGKMIDGHAMPMPLMNGDIIYVPTTAAGTWNETISQILPSLQLISGILQPFVQIEYLQDN